MIKLTKEGKMKIYNIKDKKEYIEEISILTQKERGKCNLTE